MGVMPSYASPSKNDGTKVHSTKNLGYFRHVRMLIVTVANALETDRTGHPIHDQWDWFHSWRKPGFGVTVTERKGRLNVKNVDVTSG